MTEKRKIILCAIILVCGLFLVTACGTDDTQQQNIDVQQSQDLSGAEQTDMEDSIEEEAGPEAGLQEEAEDLVPEGPSAEERLLELYGGQEAVDPKDNLIGFAIISFDADGEEIKIQWNSTTDIIMQGMNQMLIASRMYVIDMDDFSNYKMGLEAAFQGNLGSADRMVITLDRPAEGVIIFFQGLPESFGEEYVTAPLFFMVQLGDDARLVEENPRYADTLFDQVLPVDDEETE